MANLSDLIESFIKELFEDSKDEFLEIQRNELANNFKCAPSQINYVLTTRFTVDKGYYIESKRGGGGHIRIKRVEMDKNELREAIWENLGDALTQQEAEDYIELFRERDFITDREENLMKCVINDKTLGIEQSIRDRLRAQILKIMLLSVID